MVAKKGFKVGQRKPAPQVKQLVRKNKTQQLPAQVRLGDAASRYAHALIHPFSKQAEGVRVPEPYAIQTVTRKVHQPYHITTTASGDCDFSVQPNPFFSAANTLGTVSGGLGKGFANQPSGFNVYAAVDDPTLSNIFSTYRVVACGVRVKTNVDFTRSGGRLYGAVVPASAVLPTQFDVGTSVGEAWRCLAAPGDVLNGITTAIINMPRGFQFSISELMSEGGAEITFPIASPAALNFIEAQDQKEGRLATIGAAGVAVVVPSVFGQSNAVSGAGHTQLLLRGEGLQASTTVLTVEVIYHIEGVPSFKTGVNLGGANLIEAMPHTPAPTSPNELHLAHRLAAAQPVVRYVSEKLREMSSSGGPMSRAAGRAGAVVNGAERVLGIAVRGLGML